MTSKQLGAVTVRESMVTKVPIESNREVTPQMRRSIRPKRARRPFDASVDPTDARCPEQIVRLRASTISLLPRCQPRAKGSCQWHKSNLCRIPQSLEHP